MIRLIRGDGLPVTGPDHILLTEALDASEHGLPGVGRSDLLARNGTGILKVERLRVSLSTIGERTLAGALNIPHGMVDKLHPVGLELCLSSPCVVDAIVKAGDSLIINLPLITRPSRRVLAPGHLGLKVRDVIPESLIHAVDSRECAIHFMSANLTSSSINHSTNDRSVP